MCLGYMSLRCYTCKSSFFELTSPALQCPTVAGAPSDFVPEIYIPITSTLKFKYLKTLVLTNDKNILKTREESNTYLTCL